MHLEIDTNQSGQLMAALVRLYGPSVPVEAFKAAIQAHFWACVSADRAEIRFDPETNEIVSKQSRKGRVLTYRSTFRGSLTTPSVPCKWDEPVLYLQ